MTLRCADCGADLGDHKARVAFICLDVMGDEYIESYWQCEGCGGYMTEIYHDRFLGEDEVRSGALDAGRALEMIELIKQCPDPSNKRCKCPAHQKLNR